MEEALRALLLADAGVAAIAGTRVNWGEHPQGAQRPYIVLNVISGINGHTQTGADKLAQARVQIDCYGSAYGDAKILSRAVLAALDGHSAGQMQGIFHEGSRDGRDGGTNEADRPFRVSMDFMTNWSN